MSTRHHLRRTITVLIAAVLITPLGFFASTTPAGATGFTYVVNSAGDEPDVSDSDGLCLTSVDTCTLRAALTEYKYRSNTTARVEFNIPGDGPHTIQLGSQLPIINKLSVPVTIDGYSQPGAQPNTDLYGSNAVIKIHIRGIGESASNFTPIFVASPDNVIKGLAITRGFKKIKVLGADAVRNTFSGLFLGTDPAGTYGATNRSTYSQGIELATGASYNVIGGPNLADRNIVSGNAGHGIGLYDLETTHNVISNNIVGLNPMGTNKLPNLVEGIDLNQNTNNNTIGGWGPNDHNVVSGNATGGIETSHLQPNLGVRNNSFIGNWVGTTIDGNNRAGYTGNGNHGMVIQDGSRYNVIEGNIVGGNPVGIRVDPFGPGHEVIGNVFRNNKIGVSRNGTSIPNSSNGIQLEDISQGNIFETNIIANNGGRGIVFSSSWGSAVGNTFTRNSMYNNASTPGIDLPTLGQVNVNDPGDSDTGPNSLLNYPVITTSNTTLVRGTACADCRVEVFDAGPGASVNANGSGRTFVGDAVADGAGNWTVLVAGKLNAGAIATATATDEVGSTSEYSRNALVTVAPNYPPTAQATVQCTVLTCSFDGSGSTDVDGTIQTYAWQFSDGGTDSGAQVQHTFANDNDATATLTVTDNASATNSVTISVPVAPVFEIPVAADQFGRTVGSGLGAADLGGAYGYPAGHSTAFSVNGSAGLATLGSAGVNRQAFLAGANQADVEASVIATPLTPVTSGFGITSSIQLRRVANNTEYRARIRFGPGGTVFAAVTRASGTSTETLVAPEIAIPGLVWSPGTPIAIQSQIWNASPTTIRVRAWNAALPEPATWALRVTDSTAALQGAGAVGLHTYVGSSGATIPASVRYDDLSINRKGTPLPNQAPSAHATSSCVGLTCTFDGSTSTDADGTIASYTWDFGDGTSTINGSSTTHTFASYGDYNAVLTVVDDDGAVDSTPIALSVVPPPNTPPEPESDVSCLNLTCTFDGSASFDPDGTITDYAWDFGDGSPIASGPVVTTTYPAFGNYPATLTVTDNSGDSTTVDIPVSVQPTPNQLPTAVADASCTAKACSFDGSSSTDPDGIVISHSWDFGDGSATDTGATVDHTFPTFGTFNVTLTVVDNEGGPASVSIPVEVTPVFEIPVGNDSFGRVAASGWGSADAGGLYTYPSGHSTSFSVNGSAGVVSLGSAGINRQALLAGINHADVQASVDVTPQSAASGTFGSTASILLRRVANNTEYRARLRFAPAGAAFVTLTRATGSTSETVLAPEVRLADNWSIGQPVRLEAQLWGTSPTSLRVKAWTSGGAEPGGWDLSVTDTTAALQAPGGIGLRTYSGAGTVVPAVMRYDNLVITREGVVPNEPPVADVAFSCVQLDCSFDGSASNDPDGTIVDYSWDFGDGSPVTAGATPNHTFPAFGDYDVSLTVTDDDGASVTSTVVVTAEPPSNAPPIGAVTAVCNGLDCSFDGSTSYDPDGTIIGYGWDFGDFSPTANGATTAHSFPSPGTYDVTLAVTDDGGLTTFAVLPVTVTPSFSVLIANDTFTRTLASGWGAADAGGSYGYPSGHSSSFSTDGSTGAVSVAPGTQRQAFLAGVNENALDVSVRISPQTAVVGSFGQTASIQLRRIANNTEYRARVRFAPGGIVYLALTRATGSSSETVIGPEVVVAGLTWSPGSTVALRAQIWGTNPSTLRARVWDPTGSEPAGWQVNATDSTPSLQAVGGVGLHTYAGSGSSPIPVVVRYDALEVRRP